MGAHKTTAFVLRTQDYRDTSLLCTFFTRDFGKIKAVLKGGRDGKSRYGSTAEPFSLNEILFYERRRGDLHLVTGIELLERFEPLRKDLEILGSATYLVELIDQMTDTGGPSNALFDLLRDALSFMCRRHNPKRCCRIFEMKMMQFLGMVPELDVCVRCRESQSGEVLFSISSGGVVCEACRRGEGPLVLLPAAAVSFLDRARRRSFEEVDQAEITPDVDERMQRLLRQFVDYHLGYRPRSLTFLEKVTSDTFGSENERVTLSKRSDPLIFGEEH